MQILPNESGWGLRGSVPNKPLGGAGAYAAGHQSDGPDVG